VLCLEGLLSKNKSIIIVATNGKERRILDLDLYLGREMEIIRLDRHGDIGLATRMLDVQ